MPELGCVHPFFQLVPSPQERGVRCEGCGRFVMDTDIQRKMGLHATLSRLGAARELLQEWDDTRAAMVKARRDKLRRKWRGSWPKAGRVVLR